MDTAIYVRVSSDKQAKKGFSLKAQEKEGIRICKQSNRNYQVFREEGKSADKDSLDNRPELKKILELAEEEKIQYCFVTEFDRLSRNPITFACIKKIFTDNNVKVITPNQTFDFKDDEDDFISDLQGLLAKRENRLRVKRSKRAILESVLRGGWFGGVMPFGYKRENKKIVPDKEESKIYFQIVHWSLAGKGTITIARMLNDMGIVTKWTKEGRKSKIFKWKAGVVLRILKNPLYKGELNFKGNKVKAIPLISKEKWERIQENLKRNYKSPKAKYFYLLKGLIYCKKCGRRLFGKIKPSRGERLYCCLSKRADPEPRFCGLKNINLDKINNLVWKETKEIALNSSKLKQLIEGQKENSFVDEVELEVQITQIDRLILRKDEEIKDVLRSKGKYKSITEKDIEMTVSDIKSEKNNLLIQKEKLEDRFNRLRQAKEQAKHIENYLKSINRNIDSFNEQERYEFLHLLIDKIIIDWDNQSRKHLVEIDYIISLKEPSKTTPLSRYNLVGDRMEWCAKGSGGDKDVLI